MSLSFQANLMSGLTGGSLIGLAAGILLLFNSDILGASGIMSGVTLSPVKALQDPAQHWKLVFLSSFLVTARFFSSAVEDPDAQPLSLLGYALAGFFVGFGTRLSNGCTSGHGICGLARLSKRSFVSVLTFMAVAATTTVFTSPTSSLAGYTEFLRTPAGTDSQLLELAANAVTFTFVTAAIAARWFHTCVTSSGKFGAAAVGGALFARGLSLSGMVKSTKVKGFLDVRGLADGTWDPTLAFVMMGGLAVSWTAYQWIEGHQTIKTKKTLKAPLALKPGTQFQVPSSTTIDKNLVFGAGVFGLGWGIAGICPGPGLFLLGTGASPIITSWMPSFIVGSYLARELFKDAPCNADA